MLGRIKSASKWLSLALALTLATGGGVQVAKSIHSTSEIRQNNKDALVRETHRQNEIKARLDAKIRAQEPQQYHVEHPNDGKGSKLAGNIARGDRAMNPGGIDLDGVDVRSSGTGVRTAFDDPALLDIMLKAKGLQGVVYKVSPMTPPMLNALLGITDPAGAP